MADNERVTSPVADISRVDSREIRELRERYREEMSCQIVHDSFHSRGFLDSYLIRVDDEVAGYGCVGGYRELPRVTVKEVFLLPAFRPHAVSLFRQLVAASGATRIEAQTNDRLLTRLFYEVVDTFTREKILFDDAFTTELSVPGATFRRASDEERNGVFAHGTEPVGDWVIDLDGTTVATGGVLLHYNPPFGDIYMEVGEPFRGRGLGSYLVQELKRVCREAGKIPAARCNVSNEASRATLQKAGMRPCGLIISGAIAG